MKLSHLDFSASLTSQPAAAAAAHWVGLSHQLLPLLLSASHLLCFPPYWQSLAAAACLYSAAAACCLLNSAAPCLHFAAAAALQGSAAVQLRSAADRFAPICLELPLSAAASVAAAFQHCCSVQGRPAPAKEGFLDLHNSQQSSLHTSESLPRMKRSCFSCSPEVLRILTRSFWIFASSAQSQNDTAWT